MLAAGALLAAVAGAGPRAAASTARPNRPVLHVTLGRVTLPARGGPLVVRFSARQALRCQVSAPARIAVSKAWHACRRGHVRVVARVPRNAANVPRRSHVTVWAYGPGGRAAVVAFFRQAPAAAHRTPAPLVSLPAPVPLSTGAATSIPAQSGPAAPATTAPLSISTTSLPPATVGLAYTAPLTATGGTAPYHWAIASGSLPAGLSLDASGSIVGVPSAAGTAAVTIAVTDSGSPAASTTAGLAVTVIPAPYSGQASANWSGYVTSSGGSLVTEASGQWTVPQLDCTRTPKGGLATWVGIGGARTSGGGSSGVLLQTGITTDCLDGAQSDLAWWEEYPGTPNREVSFSGLAIAPGDVVRGAVYEASGGEWVTRLDDLTSGESGLMVTGVGWGVSLDGSGTFSDQGSTAGITYAGATSAEWIAEDYEESGALVPLAAYGALTFSQLTTSLSPWSLTGLDAVEMVQSGSVVSQPSQPATDGFTVHYTGP